jgi:hypothetical protein
LTKVVRFQGQTIRADIMVKAPKLRFGLPCYDKKTCSVDYCSKKDTITYQETYAPSGIGIRKVIRRKPCDEDCKRRVNLDNVSVKVCVKANCEFFIVQQGDKLLHIPNSLTCVKYIEEARGRRGKPLPFQRETRIQRRGATGGWHYRDVK